MLNKTDYSKALFKAILEKVQENACKAGKGLKDYVNDDKNIWHLSLVVYDIMPLSIKIAMRHELFYKRFEVVFKGIRAKLFKIEKNENTTTSRASKVRKTPTRGKGVSTQAVKKISPKKTTKVTKKTSS